MIYYISNNNAIKFKNNSKKAFSIKEKCYIGKEYHVEIQSLEFDKPDTKMQGIVLIQEYVMV
jgi:hypothetical protein